MYTKLTVKIVARRKLLILPWHPNYDTQQKNFVRILLLTQACSHFDAQDLRPGFRHI